MRASLVRGNKEYGEAPVARVLASINNCNDTTSFPARAGKGVYLKLATIALQRPAWDLFDRNAVTAKTCSRPAFAAECMQGRNHPLGLTLDALLGLLLRHAFAGGGVR